MNGGVGSPKTRHDSGEAKVNSEHVLNCCLPPVTDWPSRWPQDQTRREGQAWHQAGSNHGPRAKVKHLVTRIIGILYWGTSAENCKAERGCRLYRSIPA